jgi:hypothetical protein
MATLPTAEASARHILKAFVQHNGLRPGQGLGRMSLIGPFSMPGWRMTDVDTGTTYAVERGWLEPAGDAYGRLTEPGFAAA